MILGCWLLFLIFTTLTFVFYVAGTFLLAAISHRFLGGRAFLGEYFLGSRGLRSWSLAFAFAATATSAGSFIGFPALIYAYGWVLALWITSSMIYPLCAMGVLGKRLNQVARISGSLTVPDVLRDRFESPAELSRFTVHLAYENDGSGEVSPMETVAFAGGEDFVFGPGRRSDGLPFHPLGLAISYFLMWAITAMGQPGMMVRLMAFRDSKTLKRAILIVTVYFTLIYIPLVFIFSLARLLIPFLSPEDADKAMVFVAARIVGNLGTGFAVLGALFLAAPFAAVVSTVDSFLLLISSSIVRDVYQRTLNPRISDQAIRRLSYGTTVVVGILVTLLALRRIDFLQYIVVFTSSGFACTFLAPISLGLFWKRMTRQGALASAIGGLVAVLAFFIPSLWGGSRIDLLGLHPVIWGLAFSFLLGWIVSRMTGPPPVKLIEKYFTVAGLESSPGDGDNVESTETDLAGLARPRDGLERR